MPDEGEKEPKRLYILTVDTWEGGISSPDVVSVLGVFSSIHLMAKTARNYNPNLPDYFSWKLYVTQIHENVYYGENIRPDIFTWDEFRNLKEIKDILRRGPVSIDL